MNDGAERTRELAEQCLTDLYDEFSLEAMGGGYLHDTLVVVHPMGRSVFKVLTRELETFATPPIAEIVANTRSAGEAGVGAKVIKDFPEVPAVVIEWIEGRTLDVPDVQQEKMLDLVVDACRRLHTSCEPFRSSLDIFDWNRRWSALCADRGYPVATGSSELAEAMERIEAAMSVDRPAEVPCHGDLLPGNMLDNGDGEIHLIDYDYSGMAEPAWDLGGLAAENDLSLGLVEAMCRRYWGSQLESREVARARIYAIVTHIAYGRLVWSLRGATPNLLPTEVWSALVGEYEHRWEVAVRETRRREFGALLAEAREG